MQMSMLAVQQHVIFIHVGILCSLLHHLHARLVWSTVYGELWFFSIVVQCRKVYLFSGIRSNRLLYLFFGSRIWFWLEMYALFYISYFMIPFPPADNIWAIMIVQSIRGKIIRTVLCCIMYGSCTEWYAHTYAVLKLDCWFRFRFSLDVSLVLSVFAILFLCCLL